MKIENPKSNLDRGIYKILEDMGMEKDQNFFNRLKHDIPIFLEGKDISLSLCHLCKFNNNFSCGSNLCSKGKKDILKRYKII